MHVFVFRFILPYFAQNIGRECSLSRVQNMKIYIINGPNLNLLGKREPHIYGEKPFEDYLKILEKCYKGKVEISYFQSNCEGKLIDYLHKVGFEPTGIVLNAGAYTHTSLALSDAIASITSPVIEVHISNIYAREGFRRQSLMAKNCHGVITGIGLEGYKLAIESLIMLAKS